MKPFNLEEAKAGKPVCTRGNKPARVICFDCKDKQYPIVALVVNGYQESVYRYTAKGKIATGFDNSLDLMMLPEKKHGWINLYRSDSGTVGSGSKIFKSESEAKQGRSGGESYVTTVKIEWEE